MWTNVFWNSRRQLHWRVRYHWRVSGRETRNFSIFLDPTKKPQSRVLSVKKNSSHDYTRFQVFCLLPFCFCHVSTNHVFRLCFSPSLAARAEYRPFRRWFCAKKTSFFFINFCLVLFPSVSRLNWLLLNVCVCVVCVWCGVCVVWCVCVCVCVCVSVCVEQHCPKRSFVAVNLFFWGSLTFTFSRSFFVFSLCFF